MNIKNFFVKIFENQKWKKFAILIIVLTLGIFCGVFLSQTFLKTESSWIGSKFDNIKVCFTPPSGCAELIANEIMYAQKDLFIQAYVLTHPMIVDSIIFAFNKGVKINILLDFKSYKTNIKSYQILKNLGINISFDKLTGLAHNKVIVIDKKKVITGSFNFSNAADRRNAENVLLIEDEKIALLFLENWINRKTESLKKIKKYKSKTNTLLPKRVE